MEGYQGCRKNKGHNISLTLVGGGFGKPYEMLIEQKNISDPYGEYFF